MFVKGPGSGREAAIRKATDSGVPVVLLDRDIDGIENVGKVLLDDGEAGKMATELFIKQGYRKIEMISYSLGISSLEEREAGYRQTMMDHDLYDHAAVHYTTYAKANEEVPAIIKDAVARGVEAFFLPTYSLSALVLMTMRDLGLKTPDDLSVIGFDVSDIYQLYSTSVTHIVQPLKQLGEKSVDVLINMIQGKPAESVILKPEMIEGHSTDQKK